MRPKIKQLKINKKVNLARITHQMNVSLYVSAISENIYVIVIRVS